jgi:hypothetical protein
MQINKQYYFKVVNNKIVSGECEHNAISEKDLKKFQDAIQPKLDNETLLSSEALTVKAIKTYSTKTMSMVANQIITAPIKIEFEEGAITVAEFNKNKRTLKLWYRSEDYTPEPKSDAQSEFQHQTQDNDTQPISNMILNENESVEEGQEEGQEQPNF